MMKKGNRKIILGIAALACCICVVALCSFFPFIIDPSRWQTKEFLSDELIISAICILSLVCVMFIGQAGNAMNPNSNIARARVRFQTSVARVQANLSGFSQWVKQVLQPNDIRSEKEKLLANAGIEDYTVLNLEDSEIKALIGTPQKYGDRFYKGLSKKQAKAVISAKRFKMKLVDPQYYLTCSAIGSEQTISRKSGSEAKKKNALLGYSIISKVVLSVVIAMIFASLVYDAATGSGVDQASAWLKFASRMTSMATSAFMGYLIGGQMNDIDADFINIRCLVHDMFAQDKGFKPKTQQEEAKEAFAKRVQAETLQLPHAKG